MLVHVVMHICRRFFYISTNVTMLQVTHVHAKASHLIMHDLVHDLAWSVAGDETPFLDCTKPNNLFIDSCHHVAVVRYDKRLFKSLHVQVRPLRFRDSGGTWNTTPCPPGDAFSSTKNLHVLDLTRRALRKLSDPIHQLAHLRYLDASLLPDKNHPMWITSLLKLKYLSIHRSSKEVTWVNQEAQSIDTSGLIIMWKPYLLTKDFLQHYKLNLLLLYLADCHSLYALPNPICYLVNL